MVSRQKDSSVRFAWIGFAIPIILSSMILLFILYQQFERISMNMLERTNRDVLSQSDSIVKYINDLVTVSAMQTFYDEKITQLRTASILDNRQKAEAVRTLDAYGGYSSSVYSVYLYNGTLDYFFTSSNMPSGPSSSFFDQGAISLLEQVHPKYKIQPIFRYIPKPYARGLEQVYTYILYEENKNDTLDNAMIINMHANWLDTVLVNFLGEIDVLLLNDQDRVIGKTYSITAQKQQELESLIRTRSSDSGRFVVKEDNQIDLYLYSTFGDTDWCFVRHLSRTDLFHELNRMEAYTYGAIFTALLLVSLVGLFTSLRFFKPLQHVQQALLESKLASEPLSIEDYVNRLVETSSTAKIVEKGYARHLRSEYLRESLARTSCDRETLVNEFSAYEVLFLPDSPLVLVILSVEIESLMEAVLQIATLCVPVRDQEQIICFIQGSLDETKLETLCREFSCYCSISEPVAWTGDLRNSYERTRESMAFHMFEDCQCIVYRERMLDEKELSLPRQQTYEVQIISALGNGKEEQAYCVYLQFRKELSHCRLSSLRFALKRMYLATLMRSDETENEMLEQFDHDILVDCDMTLIDEIFHSVFEKRAQQVLFSKEGRTGAIVENVRQIVERDFKQCNLSVQSIADEISLSSVYLGKIFRQVTGFSIADQINEVRLAKAKQYLLMQNSMTVRQVAEESGFPNSQYFYTLFRNATKMTPNEWRKQKSSEAEC
ncbi:MAG: helix-turn-helix domain-containing protein [Sphaerochaetaceae bacterium]